MARPVAARCSFSSAGAAAYPAITARRSDPRADCGRRCGVKIQINEKPGSGGRGGRPMLHLLPSRTEMPKRLKVFFPVCWAVVNVWTLAVSERGPTGCRRDNYDLFHIAPL